MFEKDCFFAYLITSDMTTPIKCGICGFFHLKNRDSRKFEATGDCEWRGMPLSAMHDYLLEARTHGQ